MTDLIPLCVLIASTIAAPDSGTVILNDDFNREESKPELEEVGNGWGTNSKARAKGTKQVDLVDGAIHIVRAEVADHGVSVRHDAEFQDAVIELRFKIGANDDLGINIADLKEKSVHAGHICMTRIRAKFVEIVDLKTGRMDKKVRERKLAKKQTAEDKKRIKQTAKRFTFDTVVDEWHRLKVEVVGDVMSVSIDGNLVGKFQSEGIGHPTKRLLRLAVGREAWVDDVKVTRLK